MQPADAEALVAHLLAMSFDAGLRVSNGDVVGLPEMPLLLVHFEDDKHPDQRFGAWWDFHDYEEYVHRPDEVAWLASHAKIHLEEIFWTGPALEQRPSDEGGVVWCEMNTLDARLPPGRTP